MKAVNTYKKAWLLTTVRTVQNKILPQMGFELLSICYVLQLYAQYHFYATYPISWAPERTTTTSYLEIYKSYIINNRRATTDFWEIICEVLVAVIIEIEVSILKPFYLWCKEGREKALDDKCLVWLE